MKKPSVTRVALEFVLNEKNPQILPLSLQICSINTFYKIVIE